MIHILSSESDNFIDYMRTVNPSVKLYVSPLIINELKKLASADNKISKKATLALKMISDFDVITSGADNADDDIIASAVKYELIIATTDSQLKKKAKLNKVPVIYLKKDGYFSLE